MTVMRAVRIHEYGGPEAMRLDRIPVPEPAPGQILVRVHAASVNPVDWKVRDGGLAGRLPLVLPVTLGGDYSGFVAALGPGVAGPVPGTAVFGMTRGPGYAYGAYADFVAVDAAIVAPLPAPLDPVTGASVPLAALTAWQAVFERGEVSAGMRVLVHAAAGGVGSFAVQFARAAGAHVIATGSTDNLEYIRGLGAAETIDYRTTRFEMVARDIDVVIDLVGGETQVRSYAVLKRGGVLVNSWGAIMEDQAAAYGVRGVKVAVRPDRAQLAEIGRRIAAGEIRTLVAGTYPLEEAAAALERSKTGHVRGKLVITVAETT